MNRKNLIITLFLTLLVASGASAQTTNNFKQTNLVADTSSVGAAHTDANLINPWGIAFFPGGPFWISDNNSGFSTLYDGQGNIQSLVVQIPPPAGGAGPATPTGIVANAQGGFNVGGASSLFIFSTEDGTISGWNGSGNNAILAVDNSQVGLGAVYKGLAQLQTTQGTFLLATNFRSGNIDVFDGNFQPAALSGNFSDPNLPAGFAPFGIHILPGLQIYVTYALQNFLKHDPVNAAGNGIVDLFDFNGNLVRRVVSNGNLNSPWGVAIPPASFGNLGGKLLVGNFGDGLINAYDPNSGVFIDQVRDANNSPISNPSLWDMVFGGGGQSGDPNTLYLTGGGIMEMHGLFFSLAPTQPITTADFTPSVTPSTMNVTDGKSATFTVSITPTGGFNSAVSLACTGLPAQAACSFSPGSVTPNGSAATSTLTVSTTALAQAHKMIPRADANRPARGLLPLGVAGILGALFLLGTGIRRKKARTARQSVLTDLRGGILLAASALLLVAAGCGGGKANMMQTGTPHGAATITIVATSGALSHSTTITLNVQ